MPNFTFKRLDKGYDVFLRGKKLGSILPKKEATGRHCFYLGCDDRKRPRTYRGKIKAAEALQMISKLASEAKKKRMRPEALVVRAWDSRPSASDQWQ